MSIIEKGNIETILVVDDDDGVRSHTVSLLRELGYVVLEAPNGASGLLLLRKLGQTIDLLVTDVIMPQMSGSALALAAQAELPALKILFISGYTHDILTRDGKLDHRIDVLAKPFAYEALASKVRQVLDRPSA